MTEQGLRQKVLDQAKTWNGRAEWNGGHREIIDVYNQISPLPRGYRMTYEDHWCAAFVSAVGHACGLDDILYPECACDPMIAKYKAAGRWVEDDSYRPQKGDVIFYDWQDDGVGDNRGSSDHVGIVWSVYGNDMTIIEGNISDMVSFRDLKVDGLYIRGFGVPDYAGKADEAAPEIPDPVAVEIGTECTVKLPILMIGDDSEAVRAMQILLEKRGFKCGWMGADGEFGQKTESALGKFQRAYELELDGICKGADWSVLILGVKK